MSQMSCCRARSIVLYSPCTSRTATFCFARRVRSCAFIYSHPGPGERSSRPTEDTFAFYTDTLGFSRLTDGTGTTFFSGETMGCFSLKRYCSWRQQFPFSRSCTILASLSASLASLALEQAMARMMISCRLMRSFWFKILTRAAFILRCLSMSPSSRDLDLSMEAWQVSSSRAPTLPMSLTTPSKDTTAASYLAAISAYWASIPCRAYLALLIC